MENILPILFAIVAFVYSSVGLGGGSSYTALMTIFGMDYKIIPVTSLIMNMVVTFVGMINFWRNGFGRIKLILPFLVTSIPLSFFAGTLKLEKATFQILLLLCLLLVVYRIYFINELKIKLNLIGYKKWLFVFSLGAVLGFVAGSVGIGGGIFLVPLIILFGLGNEKEAAASGAVFIWLNSLAGISARITQGLFNFEFLIPLIVAVIIGGYFGSHVGAVKYSAKTIQKVMGVIIIIAILFLFSDLI